MDEKDSEAPYPRAAWKRLLEDQTGGPPETTDARIRAAARRVLAPRGGRWWLPASLAASFVLAVLIAQSQLHTSQVPVVTESDGGSGGANDARIVEREQARAKREPRQEPAAPSKRRAPPPEATEFEESSDPDSELAEDASAAGPRVGGPELDVKAASELPDEAPAASPPPAALSSEDSTVTSSVSDATRERAHVQPESQAVAPAAAAAKLPAPEAWYAEIEKLRAAGRFEEANRELDRLEQAYPGWLERYLKERAPR